MSGSRTPVFEPQLAELLRRYALLGIEHWGTMVDPGIKRHAGKLLGGRIAEKDNEVDELLAQPFTGIYEPAFRFIPLPLVPASRSPKVVLFMPVHKVQGMRGVTWFDVLVVVDATNAFGMRYEAGEDDSLHCFGHIQFSRAFLGRTLKPEGELAKLSVHYPAIPLGSGDPLRLFLSMAVAFHGYSVQSKLTDASVCGLLRQILDPDAKRARDLVKEITELIRPGF